MSWKTILLIVVSVFFPPLGLLVLTVLIEGGLVRLIANRFHIPFVISENWVVIFGAMLGRVVMFFALGMFLAFFGVVMDGLLGMLVVVPISWLLGVVLSKLAYESSFKLRVGEGVNTGRPSWLAGILGGGLTLAGLMLVGMSCMASGGC